MTQTIKSVVESLNDIFDKKQKGHDVIKRALLLFVQLESLIQQLPEPKDNDVVNYNEIEIVIKKAILSDATPASVLVVPRAICRCMKMLYTKYPVLMSKTSERFSKVLETLVTQRTPYKNAHIICVLDALAVMYSTNFSFMPQLMTFGNTFAKVWKFNEEAIRVGILTIVQNVLENNSRKMTNEFFNEIFKYIKLGASDPFPSVRVAAGRCVMAIAQKVTHNIGGSKNIDNLISLCFKTMDDTDRGVRNAFGTAVGHLLYACVPPPSPIPQETDKKSKRRSSGLFRRKDKVYTFNTALITLTSQFSKVGASRYLREAIAISVIHYLKQFQKDILESNIDVIISHLVGLLSSQKVNAKSMKYVNLEQAYVTVTDFLQAQYFVSHIIRRGITQNMNETGRLSALNELTKIVPTFANNQYALVCLLREISVLCTKLGEVAVEKRDVVLESALLCLKQPHDYVRFLGALCVRSLAESIPTQTTFLVSALLNLVQMSHAELATIDSTETSKIRQYANALHGYATALGSLISTNLKEDLSVNHMLCSAALDTAKLLLSSKNITDPYVIMRRQEACWVIVSSTMFLSEHWISINLERIMDLWDVVLGPKSKDPFDSNQREFALRCKASALLSLNTFITQCSNLLTPERLPVIYKYIEGILSYISSLPSDYKPTTSNDIYSLNILKMYLFETFRRMPSKVLLDSQHRTEFNLVTKMAFAEADGSSTGIMTSLLETILDENDDNLDDLDDVTETSDYFVYEVEKEVPFEADASCVLYHSKNFFFKRLTSLTVRVVDSAIKLVGRLFIFHKNNSRAQIMEHLLIQLKTVHKYQDDLKANETVYSNAVASTHCILRNLVRKRVKIEDKNFLTNAHSVLNLSLAHHSNRVRRAAAECMGFLGIIVGGVLIEDLIRRCTNKLKASGPVRAGYALALGHVNKALGSLTSHQYLPATVSFLHALARVQCVRTQTAALHALWYTIETTGVGFSPYIESTQQLLSALIFSPREHDRHLLICTARILHAFIGALGPEILMNEYSVSMFGFHLHDFLSSSCVSVQIAAVSLIERAIMLAPKLVELHRVLPYLRTFLDSTNSRLRDVTTSCIKIIARTHAHEIGNTFSVELLLNLLDAAYYDENQHITDLIQYLVKNKCYKPGVWVLQIREIVKSQPRPKVEIKNTITDGLTADTDKKGDEIIENQTKLHSWKTKVFALNTLKLLLETYKNNREHIDLIIARKLREKNSNADYLVFHLEKMIDLCNIAITKGSPTLKYTGLVVLNKIIEIFSDVADPDQPEEVLLQQTCAKFSAAIAIGFDSKSPLLISAACGLAASFIPSKMLKSQPKTMGRICSYLTNQLSTLSGVKFNDYGDIPATKVKLAILVALADIYVAAEDTNHEELIKFLEPYSSSLFENWTKALKDYAYLSTTITFDSPEKDIEYVPTPQQKEIPCAFYEEGTQQQAVTIYIKAFPSILNALSRVRIKLKQFEDTALLLGIAMRALHTMDVHVVGSACIQALTKVMTTETFMNQIWAPSACFEVFVLLLKIQKDRHLSLAMSSLYFIKEIVNSMQLSFFKNSSVSLESVISAAIEVCLKPIRLFFPSLLEQDSEQDGKYELSAEQLHLADECVNCINVIISKFPISINSGNITTILYTLCRVTQYTKSPSSLNAATTLVTIDVKQTPSPTQSEVSVWGIAFSAAIENLIARIQSGIITSPHEVELLYIYFCGMHHLVEQQNATNLHNKALNTLIEKLVYCEKSLTLLNYILQGIQGGIIRLARMGYSVLAIHDLGVLCGPLVVLLMEITSHTEKVSTELNQLLCTGIIPSSMNILLAAYSLVDTSNRSGFLTVMIPLILYLLRYSKTSTKRRNLSKLCIQMLERFGTISPIEFKQSIQKLPSNIVKEIQDAATQKTKPKLKKIQQEEGLSINFKAFKQDVQ